MPLLQFFALALRNCSLEFRSGIKFTVEGMAAEYSYYFPDIGAHLQYIQNQLIHSLFNCCSSYKFYTDILHQGERSLGFIDIAGLLGTEAIKQCSRVEIIFHASRIAVWNVRLRDRILSEGNSDDDDNDHGEFR